jgi:hypothetical protein
MNTTAEPPTRVDPELSVQSNRLVARNEGAFI